MDPGVGKRLSSPTTGGPQWFPPGDPLTAPRHHARAGRSVASYRAAGVPEASGPSPELLAAVTRMAGLVLSEENPEAVLALLVSLARSTVPHVDDASVSIVRTGGYETANATSENVREVDERQHRSGQGPCVEAMRRGACVNVRLVEEHDRWADFVPTALGAGFATVLSTPLQLGGRPIGALNLYSRREAAFGEAELEVAEAFAQHAAVVLGNAIELTVTEKLKGQLEEALASRDTIGKAQGILMVRHHFGAEEAFDMLRRASQHTNRKLREVARDVVDTQERQGRR